MQTGDLGWRYWRRERQRNMDMVTYTKPSGRCITLYLYKRSAEAKAELKAWRKHRLKLRTAWWL
jgi:hypothetical protein